MVEKKKDGLACIENNVLAIKAGSAVRMFKRYLFASLSEAV